jgi:hypothetical protein
VAETQGVPPEFVTVAYRSLEEEVDRVRATVAEFEEVEEAKSKRNSPGTPRPNLTTRKTPRPSERRRCIDSWGRRK